MSDRMPRRMLGVVLGLGLLCAPAASGAMITFDSSADLGNFVENGGGAPSIYSWTNADGVGTPAGAITHSNGSNADNSRSLLYTGETYAIADGPLTVSVMLKLDAGSNEGSASNFSRNFVGFASSTNVNLATQDGKLGVRLFKPANSLNWVFHLQSGTSTFEVGKSPLEDDHWYEMIVTITQTAANKFNIAGKLLDHGTDGQAADPQVLYDGSQEFTNATMAAASQWYAGLLGQLHFGGATHFDNLSIVPEPTSALGLAMAGMLLIRRRA